MRAAEEIAESKELHYQVPHKKALYICKRALHIRTRALNLRKCATLKKSPNPMHCITRYELYISAKEPYTSAQEPYTSTQAPCIFENLHHWRNRRMQGTGRQVETTKRKNKKQKRDSRELGNRKVEWKKVQKSTKKNVESLAHCAQTWKVEGNNSKEQPQKKHQSISVLRANLEAKKSRERFDPKKNRKSSARCAQTWRRQSRKRPSSMM